MLTKQTFSLEGAVSLTPSGSTILVGGFGDSVVRDIEPGVTEEQITDATGVPFEFSMQYSAAQTKPSI